MIAYSIDEDAEREVRRAIRWHEDDRSGLGQEFLLDFEASFALILNNPLQYAIEEANGARYCPFNKFSYIIVYNIPSAASFFQLRVVSS